MKVKNSSPKVSSRNPLLIMAFGSMAILILFLGGIYGLPARFSLPLAILFFWISGAMAVWHFGKR